jgi:glycerate kinase
LRVLLAFDKFKDALTAREACELAARALGDRHGDWQLDLCPLTDGGEGFAEILVGAAGGTLVPIKVEGPRGAPLTAPVGLVSPAMIPPAALARLGLEAPPSPGGKIAVIEMASASGLALLVPALRDPWRTSSIGTGQLIRAAADLGATGVLLGVGGSATHDLGLGALSALGFGFLAADGRPLQPPVPATWDRLIRVGGRLAASIPPIRIACDVDHPLLGPRGAAATFAPQKGLRAADYDRLEAESGRLAALLCAYAGQPADLAGRPGAGAAGGIAFGLMAAAGARLLPGSAVVAAWLDLEARLAAADLVLTGEGRFDASSWEGKGPGAIAARARALGKPVRVYAGLVDLPRPSDDPGLVFHAITPVGTPLPQALADTAVNLGGALLRSRFGG